MRTIYRERLFPNKESFVQCLKDTGMEWGTSFGTYTDGSVWIEDPWCEIDDVKAILIAHNLPLWEGDE